MGMTPEHFPLNNIYYRATHRRAKPYNRIDIGKVESGTIQLTGKARELMVMTSPTSRCLYTLEEVEMQAVVRHKPVMHWVDATSVSAGSGDPAVDQRRIAMLREHP
jgi:hypothetical protein